MNKTVEKILKYAVWTGLIAIFFIPLIVKKNYYFPYIVPKTLAFRVIVGIIFMAFLVLAVFKKKYRPRLNLVIGLFFLYLVVVFVSSLMAGTFYLSFWSNNERSEGLLLLFHLFLYLIVLSAFLKKMDDWLILFDASFLGGLLVSLIGLGQYFNLGWVMPSSGGVRIASTIGNASYVSGYLIFNVFFGLILLLFRKNKHLRWYYVPGIVLQLFIILNTQTRGAIISLAFASFVLVFYLTFFYFRKNKLIRNGGIALLILMVVFAGLVFLNRDKAWVLRNPVLSRAVNISFSSITAQNRLMTWQGAWKGFKEKPILGYGYENFYQVFDKYFNPKMYRDTGSVIWFDRAHNIIFDRLITGGVIGLLLYLGLLFAPLYYIWKRFKGHKMVPVIFILLIAAYFVQNLFIFEALVTYIPLLVCLGFLSQFCPSWNNKLFDSNKPYISLLTVMAVFFIPFFFIVNVKLVSANKTLIQAMVQEKMGRYEESADYFIEAIDMETANNQEYRQHFAGLVEKTIGMEGIDRNWQSMTALRAEQEFDKQIEEKPKSARNYLMFMKYLNETYPLNVARLEKSISLFNKGVGLSPTRPHFYYEVGFSQFYLGTYYLDQGDREKAKQLYSQSIANLQKAIDLNDQVVDSYTNMIMVLIATGQSQKADFYLDRMDELGLNYRTKYQLDRMGRAAIESGDYRRTIRFYGEMVKVAPNEPGGWVNLALAYAYAGEEEQAVAAAEKFRDLGEQYEQQGNLFIQDIKNGKYRR